MSARRAVLRLVSARIALSSGCRLGSRNGPADLILSQRTIPRYSQILGGLGRFYAGGSQLPPHAELAMPSLSPTMTQGNISSWRKKEGDPIGPGDILAEVETDKATIEWEAQEEGFLAKIVKGDGSKDVPVGETVAILVEDEESLAAFKDYSGAPAAAPSSSAPSPPDSKEPSSSSSPHSFPPHQIMNMPALSPTMSQGNISQWLKKVGDSVNPGDALCEVETDKATITWEAQEEGYLAAILAGDGSKDVAVGSPVAVLVEEQDALDAFKNFTVADASGKATAPSSPATPKPAESRPPSPPSQPAAAPKPSPQPHVQAPASGSRVVASPYAKKLAAEAGVSLQGAAGSGPGGRIVAADIQEIIASGQAAPRAPAAAATAGPALSAPAPSAGDFDDVTLSQIKKVTAERLLMSKQTIPHYYLTMECKVDALLSLRQEVNKTLEKLGGKVSLNDFVIKAAALALKKVPEVNSSWMTDFIRQYKNVDINVAVQTPIGLMVPFVKDADKKGLSAIAQEVKALANKAKQGKLAPSEFMGGTFTVSNLGMYGVTQFAAIVNPPQAAILAVGASTKKVVMTEEGDLKEETVMLVTLSCDHRVVDGAMGATWLQAFKEYVEEPLKMMI